MSSVKIPRKAAAFRGEERALVKANGLADMVKTAHTHYQQTRAVGAGKKKI